MIVLNVCLDNLYAFKNFNANFTYPKKIVGSSIENETLKDRPNFRYKKVNVIFGANASGKTTFGVVLMNIFNFLEKKNYEHIVEAVCDNQKPAFFQIDLASKDNVFYRIGCLITPRTDEKYEPKNIKIQILKENILMKDSYESCVRKLSDIPFVPADNYLDELSKIQGLSWLFEYANDAKKIFGLPNKDEKFCVILENILKSLDPSINKVKISQDVDNAYVITFQNKSIVIQNGVSLDTGMLSSGTKSGIAVADVLYSLIQGSNGFYYCDEKFSYIHSDIEKAILSLMIDFVRPNDQLFFTTHNTDILDMNLPKHSFTFLRKDVKNNEIPITCIEASSLLKRSTDSLRNAIENDLFSTAPAVELIYDIADLVKKESQ